MCVCSKEGGNKLDSDLNLAPRLSQGLVGVACKWEDLVGVGRVNLGLNY